MSREEKMKIIVTVKVLPEEIKLDKKTGRVIREGVKSIFNPLDLLAAREGVKLKKQCGGELIAISMAPSREGVLLTTLFKYGFDRVILITDKAFAGSDTLATVFVLSSAIKKFVPDFDIVLQGDYSLDGATGQLGGELAALLNIPFVSQVVSAKMERHLYVERFAYESIQRYKVDLPALVSVRRGINNGVVTNLFALVNAYSKDIEVYTNKELSLPEEKVGKRGSKTEVINVIQAELPSSNKLIKENGAESIMDFLDKAGIL